MAPVVDQLSDETNQQFAAEAEKELEADFDGTVDEAYQVIVATDSGVSKRGWSDCKYMFIFRIDSNTQSIMVDDM